LVILFSRTLFFPANLPPTPGLPSLHFHHAAFRPPVFLTGGLGSAG
jgi:hypothetical protein